MVGVLLTRTMGRRHRLHRIPQESVIAYVTNGTWEARRVSRPYCHPRTRRHSPCFTILRAFCLAVIDGRPALPCTVLPVIIFHTPFTYSTTNSVAHNIIDYPTTAVLYS